MQLDSSLSLRDEGLPAYHQRHVKQGAPGVFLVAVDDGRIMPVSVLVVEGLDRLTRAEPIQAQAQLAQIDGRFELVTERALAVRTLRPPSRTCPLTFNVDP